MAAEPLLDLDRDLPVTAADVEAQRRLRADLPSWFELDWTQIADSVDPGPSIDGPWLKMAGARSRWRPKSDHGRAPSVSSLLAAGGAR